MKEEHFLSHRSVQTCMKSSKIKTLRFNCYFWTFGDIFENEKLLYNRIGSRSERGRARRALTKRVPIRKEKLMPSTSKIFFTNGVLKVQNLAIRTISFTQCHYDFFALGQKREGDVKSIPFGYISAFGMQLPPLVHL